jgi:hypothetical protein
VIARQREVASQKGVFQMKNTFNLLSIIAIVAVIALSMTACGDPGDDGVPKSIRITGITGEASNSKITAGISDGGTTKAALKAYSQVDYSANPTIPLFSNASGKQGDPFTGTGLFYIVIIFEPGNSYVYSNGTKIIAKYDIQEATSTIPFDQFMKVEN